MKKLVSLLVILCLVLGTACSALAVGAPKFTKQPVTSTTDRQGNLTLSFKATDFVPNDSSWHFIEPDTGKEFTGPQLRDEMKARNVKNFVLTASDGKQRLVLNGVPKFMNGWEVYVLLVGNGFQIESDHIRIWYYGMETEGGSDFMKKSSVVAAPEGATAAELAGINIDPNDPNPPKLITVSADKVSICPVDTRGNALEDQAAPVLVFEDSGSVSVSSDTPVKYWTINGIRFEPNDSSLTGFVLKNITSDMTISAKLQKVAAAAEEVDPNSPCEITCTGCTFTYHKGGLSSVASGTVPMGATIIVLASSESAAKGFSINDEAPDHQGSTSFRLKIEGDTTITVP